MAEQKLRSPLVKTEIFTRRAHNETYKSISESSGVTRQSVTELCKNHPDEIKRIKESLWNDNIDNITKTIGLDIENNLTMARDYKSGKKLQPVDIAYKTATNKVVHGLLQQQGIMPSHAMLQMNIQNNNKIDNVDAEVFKKLTQSFDTGFIEMSCPEMLEVKDGE